MHNPDKRKKLLMREEILADGSPLPLTSIIDAVSGLTIYDERIKGIWAHAMLRMQRIVSENLNGVDTVMPPLWRGDAAKEQAIAGLGAVAVSMDSYDTTGALALRVSRHFAPGGSEYLGVGSRPGTPALEAQLRKLQADTAGEPVILLDDDTYTGGTAGEMIGMMQTVGMSVLRFIPGLQVADVNSIWGVPVQPIERYDPSDVLDVVDPRDFIFGAHEAGLVINDDGLLYRAPYVLPWVDLTVRAGIPAGNARMLSADIIELNHWLYRELEQVSGRPVGIADTAQAFQDFVGYATSYPVDGTMTGFCDYARTATA